MNCDICGRRGELFYMELEGSRLVACKECVVHGKKLGKVVVENSDVNKKSTKRSADESSMVKHTIVEKEGEPVILVVDNYTDLIKNKRERLGLKQEDLAKAINEKESLIQQIEGGKIEPSIKVAEKLEHYLKIDLLETYKPQIVSSGKTKEKGPVTLGDMVKIRTRKRK